VFFEKRIEFFIRMKFKRLVCGLGRCCLRGIRWRVGFGF
jgi:hypothetical protein